MALFNVSTAGNTLLATDHTANCESEIINQDVADTDFESIRETRVYWRLANISSGLSSANTLVSDTPIFTNDRIFIRTNNGAIYDTTAQGVVQNTAPIHPNMTSNTLPQGTVIDNSNRSDAWKAFDGNPATYTASNYYTNHWVGYNFFNNEPHQVFSYHLKFNSGGNSFNSNNWVIEGSLDGTNWSTISTEVRGDLSAGTTYNIESPGFFSWYRIRFTYIENYNAIKLFSLLGPGGTTVDTTAVTNGEIPDQVFKFTDTVSFNGAAAATQKDVFYEYGTTGTKLSVTSLYNDYSLGGRTLKTRFDFTSAGNEVTEITGQIFKDVV